MKKISVVATAVVLGWSSMTYAKETATSPRAEHEAEIEAVRHLHDADQIEIKAGNLAAQRGQTDAVRNYGKQLAADHNNLESQVQAVADKLDLPLKPVKAQELAALSAQEPETFDQVFLAHMEKDHKHAISTLEHERKQLANTQVIQLVDHALPVLRQHLRSAERLRADVGRQAGQGKPQSSVGKGHGDVQPTAGMPAQARRAELGEMQPQQVCIPNNLGEPGTRKRPW